MTLLLLYFMKKFRLHNVSIHRNYYQNRFINKYTRKKKAKISDFQSFTVRYRRNYVLKNREKEKRTIGGKLWFIKHYIFKAYYSKTYFYLKQIKKL